MKKTDDEKIEAFNRFITKWIFALGLNIAVSIFVTLAILKALGIIG